MTPTPPNHPIAIAAYADDAALRAIAATWTLDAITATAAALRDEGHGAAISYSRKVFIPLTRLCRDSCHYCTFAHAPRPDEPAYLDLDAVLAIARAGQAAGCREALFTLGDKPEQRYGAARRWLSARGYSSTIDYLVAAADAVHRETGLMPHANPGVMTAAEIARLRQVSISQGIMLETVAARLSERGGPHFGSPDKHPTVRLETIELAGHARVPFTSGILIGIGETRNERLDALFALRDIALRHGHIQEVIVQNFRAKPGTRMAAAPHAEHEDLMWTIAMARLVFGPQMNIQAPPNLSTSRFGELIDAGLNDWGGVSPVTPDHVNPEAPWPDLDALAATTAAHGKVLVERLASYPAYVEALQVRHWHDRRFVAPILRASDASGFVREDAWSPGNDAPLPRVSGLHLHGLDRTVVRIAEKAQRGTRLNEVEIVQLFGARGATFDAVLRSADDLRASVNGDTVSYVVNRNINYTNICGYKCRFCAFSKGAAKSLRGTPYDLDLDEIVRRAKEASARGGTEVCLQGGIHPDYTGDTYLAICRAIKAALPDMHVHAFSPLEITHGAQSVGVSVSEFLDELKSAGLGTLPGTAAEVLDDVVRRELCPDKLSTAQWLDVVCAAHRAGLDTTATIMFGHIDHPMHWARHLLAIRDLQQHSLAEGRGAFTEIVPLPFVHMEAPMYLKGSARMGPTFREVLLMHAIARLALNPVVSNIQASWVKLGPDGVQAALAAGVNDLGGTLMNESITRAAGTIHGEELEPLAMERLIRSAGRVPRQRTTRYDDAPAEMVAASYRATAITPRVELPPRRGAPARMAGAVVRQASRTAAE